MPSTEPGRVSWLSLPLPQLLPASQAPPTGDIPAPLGRGINKLGVSSCWFSDEHLLSGCRFEAEGPVLPIFPPPTPPRDKQGEGKRGGADLSGQRLASHPRGRRQEPPGWDPHKDTRAAAVHPAFSLCDTGCKGLLP